uniref:O-antigen ligase family protein n=1 Tax=uncultured Halomonas sp. TaxID=173971 RepID=UPI002603654E|nr:O-antigen ligase family protein [uncultured Halomonas sp.]
MTQPTDSASPVSSAPIHRSLPLQRYTGLAVFLLGAIALVVPSGYSLGAVMLLLGSTVLLIKRPTLGLDRRDLAIMTALTLYAVIRIAAAWWDGQGWPGVDKPSRFMLAIPAMLLVMAYPPRLSWFWGGLAIGAIGAGSWAGWQKLVVGVERATGYTYVIQFGNLSMLMGILCLAGLGWAYVQRRRHAWLGLMAAGTLLGVLGSLFSGSRGGWVGIPFVLLVLYRGYGRHLSLGLRMIALAAVIVAGAVMYALPQTGVQPRVLKAFDDIERYAAGEGRTSSLGARFEMWKGATHLIMDKPLKGWGDNGYRQGMRALGDAGVVHPRVAKKYGHPHNEFLNELAKRGVIGLVALLALYLVPMRLFGRQMAVPDLERRSLAIAGVLLPVAYIDFGLSQAFLAHNSGTMMFAFLLAVLWGCLRAMGMSKPA